MSNQKVIIDYSKVSDEEIDNLAQSIYDALNPNTNFTWKTDVMPGFLAAITDYRDKHAASVNGNTQSKTVKNLSKKVLIKEMHDVASEVNIQANGDLLKLKSSGFFLTQDRSPVGVLPKPTGFIVKSGNNSGEVLCSVDANEDADMYYFYYAEVPLPARIKDYHLEPSTNHKKIIAGLTPGKQYVFVSAYKGTHEELIYSEPFYIFAQ